MAGVWRCVVETQRSLMSNTISIGKSSDAEFCAYGDEAQFQESLVFAFAVVRRSLRQRAIDVLNRIRSEFWIPWDTPLHCRILFNEHARRKHGMGYLSQTRVHALLDRLVQETRNVPVVCRFATTVLPKRNPLVNSTAPFFVLPNEPKGVLGLLMQCCFANKQPNAEQCEIFVSADPTKIRFMGKNKYQAHRGYRGFSDIGAPAGMVFEIEPHIVSSSGWKDEPLVQLADVFCYICSHADGSLVKNDMFTQLLKQMHFSRGQMMLQENAIPQRIES